MSPAEFVDFALPWWTRPALPPSNADTADASDLVMSERREAIDDVPVWWEPWAGDFGAALMFRVGAADETPSTRGITHLVEHLAMPRGRAREITANAQVEAFHTLFYADGPRQAVLAFITGVCKSLQSLPLDRIEHERGILLTEAEGLEMTAADELLAYRFGLRGLGCLGVAEFGLRRVGAVEAQAWAARMFNRRNAVLMVRGEPDGAELPLADGGRLDRRDPTLDPDLERTSLGYGGGGATVTFLGPGTSDFIAAVRITGDRAERVLRHERGLVYDAGSGWLEAATMVHASRGDVPGGGLRRRTSSTDRHRRTARQQRSDDRRASRGRR